MQSIAKLFGLYYKLKYEYILRRAKIGLPFLVRGKFLIRGPGRVLIGRDCSVNKTFFGDQYTTLVTHDTDAQLTVGSNVILRGTKISCHDLVKIDDNSVLENVSIFDTDFHNIDATQRDNYRPFNQPVIIEKNCYIGMNVLLTKGTSVGAGSTILPGSNIMMKKIPHGSTVMGFPARVLKSVTPS